MTREEKNRVVAIVHPQESKTLWRVVMKAGNMEEAKKIIIDEYPSATIVYAEEVKPLTQGKLF